MCETIIRAPIIFLTMYTISRSMFRQWSRRMACAPKFLIKTYCHRSNSLFWERDRKNNSLQYWTKIEMPLTLYFTLPGMAYVWEKYWNQLMLVAKSLVENNHFSYRECNSSVIQLVCTVFLPLWQYMKYNILKRKFYWKPKHWVTSVFFRKKCIFLSHIVQNCITPKLGAEKFISQQIRPFPLYLIENTHCLHM